RSKGVNVTENERNMIVAPAQDSWPLPNLPEEIIMQILLRLPVKSLLKFRCVSQSWRFLISSYNFAKAHIEVSTKNSKYAHDRLIFGSRDLPVDLYTCSLRSIVEDVSSGSIYPMIDESLIVDRVWFDCPLCELHDVICQEGSCNGLVCLALSVSTLILWNPTTRKHRVLPESVKDLDLNFDYIEITFGFGYDELNDDYKVVEISYLERDTGVLETQVKVYSLRNDSWKTLSNWPGGDTFGGCGKFLNGAIHWSVSGFDNMDEWAIVSHDLATDTFRELLLPDIEDDDVRVEIKLLGGSRFDKAHIKISTKNLYASMTNSSLAPKPFPLICTLILFTLMVGDSIVYSLHDVTGFIYPVTVEN
ncbi:F-box/kelch-repeat protein, partial [Sesamum alatum]